jgi:hypothetical protein
VVSINGDALLLGPQPAHEDTDDDQSADAQNPFSPFLKSWRVTRKGSPKPRAGVPTLLQRNWPCRRAGKGQTVDADFVSCTSAML